MLRSVLKNNLKLLKRIYLLIESVLAVIITILLADSFICIYRAGSEIKSVNPLESIYTREVIAKKFYYIAPVLIIFAVMTLCGLVLGVKTSSDAKIDNDFIRAKTLNRKSQKNLQVIIILIAILLIISGVINSSARDVLYKAINICSECIGLG